MAGGNVPAQYAPVFNAAGKANRIPPAVLAGVASVESNFGQNQGPSSAGAVGWMQFLPSTAKGLGVNPQDPRQAIFGAAKLLNQYGYQQNPTRAIAAYNAGPGNYQAGLGYAQQVMSEAKRVAGQLGSGSVLAGNVGGNSPNTTAAPSPAAPTTSFDQAGFQQAQRQYLVGNYLRQSESSPYDISKSNVPNPTASLARLLPTMPPNRADYTTASAALQKLAGNAQLTPHPGVTAAMTAQNLPNGIAQYAGKPVAAWIAPILQYAAAHGWKGSVSSGFRTLAQQTAIYNSGVRPAAAPGTSNHEQSKFPGGAVDVTNAAQLSAILARSPYAQQLVWAGSKDPVHFSHPHNGGY